jgi:hypothetical protein
MYFILRTSFLGSLNLTVIPKLRVAERLRITLPTVDNTPLFPVGQRLLSGDGLDQSNFRNWPIGDRFAPPNLPLSGTNPGPSVSGAS